jgi:hypothetical protein
MEDSRFDALTKAMATPTSRRQALKALGASVVGGILGLSRIGTALADKPLCRGNGSKCSLGKQCCSGYCANNVCTCPPAPACNSACPCPSGSTCVNGTCCPSSQACNGTCCPSGQGCCNGTCTDLNTTSNCGSCGNTCTSPGQICQNGQCVTSNLYNCTCNDGTTPTACNALSCNVDNLVTFCPTLCVTNGGWSGSGGCSAATC